MNRLRFSRQPLAWLHVIALALSAAIVFGANLTVDQAAAVMALLQAFAAAVGWKQVTPVKHPKLPPALPPGPIHVQRSKKPPAR